MTETYGQLPQTYVAWGLESTYGTATTSIANWELWQNVSIEENHNLIPVKGLGARETQHIATGGTDGRLSGEIILQDFKMLTVLGGFSDATSGTEAPYTHTLTPSTTINSGTVEIGHDGTSDVIYKASGFQINSWTLNATVDDIAKVSFDGIFQDIDDTDTTAQSPSLKTPNPFAIAELSAKIGDAALTEVNNASITLTNNVQAVRGLGTPLYTTGKAGGLDIAFNCNATMRDTTYFGYLDDDTEIDFELLLYESASRSITITLNNARINSWTEAVDVGGGAVNATFEGMAYYDATESNNDVYSILVVDANAISADYDSG